MRKDVKSQNLISKTQKEIDYDRGQKFGKFSQNMTQKIFTLHPFKKRVIIEEN